MLLHDSAQPYTEEATMALPRMFRWQVFFFDYIKPEIHYRQRRAEGWRSILHSLCLVLKKFFSFCEARHVPSTMRMRMGISQACLNLMYRQLMAWIVAASGAYGSVCCAFYTRWGEAVMLRLVLPLSQVYSRLNIYLLWCRFLIDFSMIN